MSRQNQQVSLKVKGLYLPSNDFSGVPEGALNQADDVVIDYTNLIESRRGFEKFGADLPAGADRAIRLFEYQGFLIARYGTNKLAYYNSGWNAYSGTYSNPDDNAARSRFFTANQNLYISTGAGVYKLDVYSGTPTLAGVPKGLDLQLSLSGSSGFFDVNTVNTVTGTTTNASPNLTVLSDISGIAVGQYVSGTGITAGTTVSSITPSSTLLITDGDPTIGSTAIANVTSITGIAANNFVSGAGIPDGTRVVSTSGVGPYTVNVDTAAIKTGTNVELTFSSDPTITMSANATATGSVSISFSEGSQIGYRVLWGIKDNNGNLILGAPSQFATLTNNVGASRNVALSTTIPSGITTSHFIQVYRSPQTASASVTPSDDEQLVYEANPTSVEISAGTISITDSTPDTLRGAFLYTSISQEGISQQNDRPPFCKDFCSFNGMGIYANIKTKQRLFLTVLGVGGSSGIALDDTLTIAGTTYTAKSTETVASGYYQLVTSGTPAQNIADTVDSLIKVINQYSSNTSVYAYLLSGPNDLPGQIVIEERGFGASSFAATASARGSAYSPTLPTSGTSVSSEQDEYLNGIQVSKKNQPESVPEENLFFAGDASAEILRVIPLREYVAVLKEDGIYRLTGQTPQTISISPFDLTTRIISPDSAVTLSNEVWGLFDQGVCSVSDTGVQVRSDDTIEPVLRQLIATAKTTLKKVAFGVGYETDRRYILALPSGAGSTATTQQYCLHKFTNAWVRWTRSASSGYVRPSEDVLYMGVGDDNTVVNERKSSNFTDFVDEAIAVTISSSSGYEVVLNSVAGIVVGDLLFENSSTYSVITAIDLPTNTVTVADVRTWTNSSASVLTAINCVVQWKPLVAGNPAFVRQYSEGMLLFKRTRFNTAILDFYSDVSQSYEGVTMSGVNSGGWGLTPWGSGFWGGVNRPIPIRFLVPRNKQICSQLSSRVTIRSAYSDWSIEGLSLSFNNVSQEVYR